VSAARHPNGLRKRNPLRDVPPIEHTWVPPTRPRQAQVDRAQRRADARAKAVQLAAANARMRAHRDRAGGP
jgi:hypothetical protein